MSYDGLDDDALLEEAHKLQAAKDEIRAKQREIHAVRSARAQVARAEAFVESLGDHERDVVVKAVTAAAKAKKTQAEVV